MRTAVTTILTTTAFLASLAAPALADDPQPAPPGQPQTEPAPEPAPAPAAGKVRMRVRGGLRSRGRAYVLEGQAVTVIGRVKPYVPGQLMRVRISTPKRRPAVVHARIRKAKKGAGRFRVRFRTRRDVTYAVYARHDETAEQALFDDKIGVRAVSASAHEGKRSIGTALLKLGLRRLGYPAGHGPFFTGALARSLMAFRRANGMARTFAADRSIFKMVFAHRGGFELRYPDAGKHVEADLSRQVIALADGKDVVATYYTSSGKPSTPTILGHYRFYLKSPGTNAKGMYMSNYFIRGYAIHGYPDVPTYPASHGCLRVPNADANAIYGWIALGDDIYVYP